MEAVLRCGLVLTLSRKIVAAGRNGTATTSQMQEVDLGDKVECGR